MPGPLAAAGAISNPTRYGALNMQGEQFTGLWTQAGPYRDAATAYLIRKFYQGNRFDRIIDGLNREIGVKLTDVRRPGMGVYNSNTFPAGLSYYPFKWIQNGAELVRVIYDGVDGNIYDATAGQKTLLYAKAAGAGAARFLGVNAELFFGDGVEQKKILRSSLTWKATTGFNAGNYIIDTNGNVQLAIAQSGSIGISNITVSTVNGLVFVDLNLASSFPFANQQVTLAGLTTRPNLNGLSVQATRIALAAVKFVNALGLPNTTITGETGTVAYTTTSGTSGGSTPGWNATPGGTTTDGSLLWQNMGSPVENWQIAAPTAAPTLTGAANNSFWYAYTKFAQYACICDPNGNYQVQLSAAGVSGSVMPTWALSVGAITWDGAIGWRNIGVPGGWNASYATASYLPTCYGIIDSNGNVQYFTNLATTGTTVPSWATTVGSSTSDGGVTWICCGPGTKVTFGAYAWCYAWQCVDGSVSTASPLAQILTPILGAPGTTLDIAVTGFGPTDPQCGQVWVFRTAQGQATPVYSGQVANPGAGTSTSSAWTYVDTVPDISIGGGPGLNAEIPAPIASANNPPPAGLTGPVYYLQRIWGFVGNTVFYSGGGATLTGNGNTAWPPLNEIPLPGGVIKLVPVTVENGGLLAFTTSGVWIVLGAGTATNPFYTTLYCDKVNLASYTTLDLWGSVIYLMEANAKVSSLTIQYPFNPQSGYAEVGLPIGDQFMEVTTGGIASALYAPATSYLSICVANTRDTGMYVADGAVGWFRMSAVSPPESGLLWSPRAAVMGGTSAVQSVETSPGVYQLLAAPAVGSTGPILARDQTGAVWTDNGTAYDAYDTKGVNLLCSTGQWTEVAHISAKSAAVGARPVVSVLLNEIAAVPAQGRSWDVLTVTGPDPVRGKKSKSVYSDRYDLAQNGVEALGDCILTRFDYGTQAVADELLDWGIYASTEEERKEEAQK